MGFEPTTFCMASGSWVQAGERKKVMVERNRPPRADLYLRVDCRSFGAIARDLGTRKSLVPNQ